jgi:TPR repeat protein
MAKDEVEAVKWYRKAAEQGDELAQFNLGVMYDNGQGVAKDDVEAAKWYRKAAEQGIAIAQINLGVAYVNGQGVAKDQVEAYAFFNLAAIKDADGRKAREKLEKILSRDEIAAGQRRTRELQKEIEAKQKGAP